MKQSLIVLLCLFFACLAFGQDETKQINIEVEELEVTPPKFTGIMNSATFFTLSDKERLNRFLVDNFRCPAGIGDTPQEGTEVIHFTVQPDGTLSDFEVINSVCWAVDQEMIALLETTNGKWMPGIKDGKPVAMDQEVVLMLSCRDESKTREHFVKMATRYTKKANSIFWVKNKPKKALRFYNKAAVYTPNAEGLLLVRGICNYELGNEESARRDWNRIIYLGGYDYSEDYYKLVEMKGFEEMSKILLAKNK